MLFFEFVKGGEFFSFCRLRQDRGGGAWCPKTMVTSEGKDYLEINLHSPRIITSSRTQGRFGNGKGVEYAEEFFIEYWRPSFNKWVRWRNRRSIEVSASLLQLVVHFLRYTFYTISSTSKTIVSLSSLFSLPFFLLSFSHCLS